MLLSHHAGDYAGVMMVAGGLIIGFTVLSAFTATRVYLSEQFPTALRGRGQIFGESFGRLFAGGFAPFLMEPHTGSAPMHDICGRGDRRLHSAILWPRDRGPAGNRHRRSSGAGLRRG